MKKNVLHRGELLGEILFFICAKRKRRKKWNHFFVKRLSWKKSHEYHFIKQSQELSENDEERSEVNVELKTKSKQFWRTDNIWIVRRNSTLNVMSNDE